MRVELYRTAQIEGTSRVDEPKNRGMVVERAFGRKGKDRKTTPSGTRRDGTINWSSSVVSTLSFLQADPEGKREVIDMTNGKPTQVTDAYIKARTEKKTTTSKWRWGRKVSEDGE